MAYAPNIGDALTQLVFSPALARTTTNQGPSVDLAPYEGQLVLFLDSAAGTGTTPTLDVVLQDSADGSSWANVSPAIAFTQVTNAGVSRQKLTANIMSLRRFVRVNSTLGGTTPSFVYAVVGAAAAKYPA
jgi:hypothetical protein